MLKYLNTEADKKNGWKFRPVVWKTIYCIFILIFDILTVRPSLRGSCPLDVAYSSLMDNNELALALRESHLERIVAYLSRAGVQVGTVCGSYSIPAYITSCLYQM